MRTGKSHAAVVLEPDDDTVPLRVGAGMIGTGNAIAVAVGGDYEKRLKWTGE